MTAKHSLYNIKFPFPFKLHEMLEDVILLGQDDIVSWQPHGRAFRVHKPKEFAIYVMPRYFKQTVYKSFQRQLHLYGFHRIGNKRMWDAGAYCHKHFVRGQKEVSLRKMSRCKIKGSSEAHESSRMPDPDFYKNCHVPSLPHLPSSTSQWSQEEPRRERFKFPRIMRTLKEMTPDRITPCADSLACPSIDPCTEDVSFPSSGGFTGGSSRSTRWMAQTQNILAMQAMRSTRRLSLLTCSVLRTPALLVADENKNMENNPLLTIEDGDELFFEGKKFFFVENDPTPRVRTSTLEGIA